jgi:hypothetical protein
MLIMKNFYRLIKTGLAFSLLGMATFASAQVEQTAELKVTINDIISFTLSDVTPSLTFDEASDFTDGVSYSANSAGTIISSGAFSLSVKAEKGDLEDSSGNKIDVGSISLTASGTDLGTTEQISLGTSEQDIISAAPAAISKTFDLTYATTGNDTEFIGKPAGDYTVELTFTATLD